MYMCICIWMCVCMYLCTCLRACVCQRCACILTQNTLADTWPVSSRCKTTTKGGAAFRLKWRFEGSAKFAHAVDTLIERHFHTLRWGCDKKTLKCSLVEGIRDDRENLVQIVSFSYVMANRLYEPSQITRILILSPLFSHGGHYYLWFKYNYCPWSLGMLFAQSNITVNFCRHCQNSLIKNKILKFMWSSKVTLPLRWYSKSKLQRKQTQIFDIITNWYFQSCCKRMSWVANTLACRRTYLWMVDSKDLNIYWLILFVKFKSALCLYYVFMRAFIHIRQRSFEYVHAARIRSTYISLSLCLCQCFYRSV